METNLEECIRKIYKLSQKHKKSLRKINNLSAEVKKINGKLDSLGSNYTVPFNDTSSGGDASHLEDLQCQADTFTKQERRPTVASVVPSLKPGEELNQDSAPRKTETFEEFSGYTTLHGLRFIGDRTSALPRRLFWVLLVLLCSSLFGLQTYDRITHFLSSPVTVNIKVNYADNVVLPAVTLCNQNNFRISKAYEGDWLDFLHEFYDNNDDMPPSSEQHLNTSITELFEGLAHTKEDFIIKCQWEDEECSAANFTTTLTSSGICFTFNKVDRPEDSLTLHSSGVEHALKLTLNTENYERTAGPHDTTGIKVLMTDQHEVPRVEDIGIALSTGIHAFVGISVMTLNNLQPPYGECGEVPLVSTQRYDKWTCLLECETQYAYDNCRCRHFYMPDLTGGLPVCNVRQFLTCLQATMKNFNNVSQTICTCPTSCHYNIYEPTVSYATSSHMKTDVEDAVNETIVKERLFATKEISTKMEERLHGTFNASLGVAIQNVKQMISDLQHTSYNYLMAQYNTIGGAFITMDDAIVKIGGLYDTQFFIIENHLIRGRDRMLDKTLTFVCHDHVGFIRDVQDKIEHIVLFNQDDVSVAKHIYLNLVSSLNYKQDVLTMGLDNYTQLINAYKQGELFNNTVLDDHQRRIVVRLSSYLTSEKQAILNMSMAVSSLEAYATDIFVNTVNQTDNNRINQYTSDFQDACEKLITMKESYFDDTDSLLSHTEWKLEQANTWFAEFEAKFRVVRQNYRFMTNFLRIEPNSTLPLLLDELFYAQEYLNENYPNVTKNDVAETNSFGAKLNAIQAFFDNIELKKLGYGQELDSVNDILDYGFNVYYNLNRYNEFSDIQEALMNMTHRIHNWYPSSLISTSDRNIETLHSVASVVAELEEHHAAHDMDEAFYRRSFLQVDIYFKELRNEEIAQQKAYDEIALFCDIGGATGLLIGGSVITLFEIAEFLLMCLVCRVCCKRAKMCQCKVAPHQSPV